MSAPPKKHRHKWSKPYRDDGGVRYCENGPCGAVRFKDGTIIKIYDGTKRKP